LKIERVGKLYANGVLQIPKVRDLAYFTHGLDLLVLLKGGIFFLGLGVLIQKFLEMFYDPINSFVVFDHFLVVAAALLVRAASNFLA
jgi:hypothetical protein